MTIVLVIIGLIVGGVLVGQNPIASATMRAHVTQIEKFNHGANAFFEKYGYLPGDIPAGPAGAVRLCRQGRPPWKDSRSCPGGLTRIPSRRL
jgi:hypothetical protein